MKAVEGKPTIGFKQQANELRSPGIISVNDRVIFKIIQETSARAIGLPRGSVGVETSDLNAGIAIRISTKLPIPSLNDLAGIKGSVSLMESINRLQSFLTEELAHLTGLQICRISFIVTGAVISKRKRVI